MGNATSLQALKDAFAKAAHGMTKDEAIAKNICIHCKKPIHEHEPSSEAGIREYKISGIYGDQCWDAQFDAGPSYTNQDPDLKPKKYYPDFTMYAHQMLDEAKCEYTVDDIHALTVDLTEMCGDFDGDMGKAKEVLEGRIGGLKNLRSYVSSLRAKPRKL